MVQAQDYNEWVGWIAIVLLAAAVLVLVGAEWPRLSERFGADAWTARSRSAARRSAP